MIKIVGWQICSFGCLRVWALCVSRQPNVQMCEEPETNLHPKLQSSLADIFVNATKRQLYKNMFIIETHSEYLIRKLQYLTAKGTLKPEDVIIYYFNHPDNIPEGEKHIKKITIKNDGSLSDDFGKGFYDEATTWKFELTKLRNEQGN